MAAAREDQRSTFRTMIGALNERRPYRACLAPGFAACGTPPFVAELPWADPDALFARLLGEGTTLRVAVLGLEELGGRQLLAHLEVAVRGDGGGARSSAAEVCALCSFDAEGRLAGVFFSDSAQLRRELATPLAAGSAA